MLDPAQPVPPTQVLVRVRVPPLQVRLQLDHVPQLLHEPVAASRIILVNVANSYLRDTIIWFSICLKYRNHVHANRTLTCSSTVEGIDMLNIWRAESISLSQGVQWDAGVNRLNGWLAISREGKGTIVHDGSNVIGYALSGHNGRRGDFEIVLCTCKWRLASILIICITILIAEYRLDVLCRKWFYGPCVQIVMSAAAPLYLQATFIVYTDHVII